MIGKTIQPEIRELIANRNMAELRESLSELHPSEVAELIMDIPESDRAVVFRILPKDISADVFEYLELDEQKEIVKILAQPQLADILNEMSPDDRTAFLEELPDAVVRQLMALLSPEERTIATTLLGYPEGSIGRAMTPDFIDVPKDWTIQQVMTYIREHGKDSETINVIYVTDAQDRLIGELPIRKILLASPEQAVKDVMMDHFVSLTPDQKEEDALQIFREYDRDAIPVVSPNGILLGIVTADDVLDIAEETSTEDIQKFGGLEALEYPYRETPLVELVKKRAGWLVVLFLGEMLTATAMGYFEDEIARAVVLALFVPLIISSGGNSGSQAATLIIRAMALGEITLKSWWYVMRREIISGLMLGTILAAIGFLRIAAWSVFSEIYGPHWPLIALTVSLSLVGVVLWGTLSGSMLPFLLRRLGFDPAASSAPFVATLVDVTGLIIYFSVAAIVLGGVLL